MHKTFYGQIRKTVFTIAGLGLVLLICLGVLGAGSASAQGSKYFIRRTIRLSDGTALVEYVINGPPVPPPGYEVQRLPVTPPKLIGPLDYSSLTVPAFAWSFGCSATSGAMIAAYYDRNGFANIYTGPTNGGVMPLDSSSWSNWTDSHGDTYAQCPLTASHLGLDGRATRGSIDDYWVAYMGGFQDPYLTNGWTQHTWGDGIGDFMKTSQSAYNNDDGSTSFYNYNSSSPLTCSGMEGYGIQNNDGTYGRKLFYQARGYTVTDCYSQNTDNNYAGGFSFTQYKAEIDAGRPVMLNLAGHTIVGVGYDTSANTVYLHDTWDYATHSMTWGSSYAGMQLLSVSIVNIQIGPGAFNKSSPSNGATNQPTNLSLSWGTSSGATSYEYCYDSTNDNACSSWNSTGTATSASLSGLTPATTYYWQVRAKNNSGTTYANGSSTAFWSFSIQTATPTSTPSLTPSPTKTATFTPTLTNTPTNTKTSTPTATATVTNTPTLTYTPTSTFTSTSTSSPTATRTFTPTSTNTASFTPSKTPTFTYTPTFTSTPSSSPSATRTFTPTSTNTATFTRTFTYTPTFTSTPTSSPTATRTFTPTSTNTATFTRTFTYTPTFTSTPSSSPTATQTFTPTSTNTATFTRTFTLTYTPTFTPTPTSSPTATRTFTPTSTYTPTFTRTFTLTSTVTRTSTPTLTTTRTPTPTSTPNGQSYLLFLPLIFHY